MSKNILIITQKVDAEDDLLGFFVDWLGELSKHFERVFVITLAKGSYDLSENVFVYSLGKEGGNSKFARMINFYRLLFKLIPKSSGVFAHMSPVFVTASWPIAFVFRKKIILWYLHRSVTMRLKIAEKLCYKIVTAAKESLNIKSPKIVELGHGINIDKFKTKRNWSGNKLRVLSVGRISPIKNYETLIKAMVIFKNTKHLKVEIIGRPVMPLDFQYFDKLKNMTGNGTDNIVNFIGYVPYTEMSGYYKKANLVINLTPTGGLDKAVLEAMASGCIVLTSNINFSKYLGQYKDKLLFDFDNPENLALKIEQIKLMDSNEKTEISNSLVRSVEQNHNLINLINKVSKLYG